MSHNLGLGRVRVIALLGENELLLLLLEVLA